MQCPTCHTPLTPNTLHGQTIDRCLACDGLWLDDSELGPIVRQTTPPSVLSESISPTGDLVCPRCDKALSQFDYAHDSGVLIHKCPSCSGIWLLPGQLERLAQYRTGNPAIDRLADAMADQFRVSNRWQFARNLLRSRLLSSVVAIGYLVWIVLTSGSLQAVFNLGLFLALPMACIWFPDEAGRLRRIGFGLARPRITHTTPGDIVALGGWLALLSPILAMIIVRM